jgi:hypothetical protein
MFTHMPQTRLHSALPSESVRRLLAVVWPEFWGPKSLLTAGRSEVLALLASDHIPQIHILYAS